MVSYSASKDGIFQSILRSLLCSLSDNGPFVMTTVKHDQVPVEFVLKERTIDLFRYSNMSVYRKELVMTTTFLMKNILRRFQDAGVMVEQIGVLVLANNL